MNELKYLDMIIKSTINIKRRYIVSVVETGTSCKLLLDFHMVVKVKKTKWCLYDDRRLRVENRMPIKLRRLTIMSIEPRVARVSCSKGQTQTLKR